MTTEERLDRIETIIEKQNTGIRDLIVVGRLCVDSIRGCMDSIHGCADSIQGLRDIHLDMVKRMDEDHRTFMRHMEELREAQAETDQKLNILIDTVDRIIRRNGSKEE